MSSVCTGCVYSARGDAPPEPAPRVRIGELSDRVGESPTLLRAWERRYGLLSPVRSAGGFRLYGAEDERRVRAMQGLLAAGVSARQAAEAVLSTPAGEAPAAPASDPKPAGDGIKERRSRLTQTLGQFDDVGANAVLDRLLADMGATTVISEVIVPYLVDLGERWADGTATIAEEHFATSLIRGRLLGLARGWDGGSGPRALLACPSGELHDLGLICFGIALRGHGWRITYLGADTPQSTLIEAAAQLTPNLHRAGSDEADASTSVRPRDSNRTAAVRRCGKRRHAHGSPTSSVPHSSTSIPSPPRSDRGGHYGELSRPKPPLGTWLDGGRWPGSRPASIPADSSARIERWHRRSRRMADQPPRGYELPR